MRQNISIIGAFLCFLFLLVTYCQTVIEIYGYYRLNTATSYVDVQFLRFYYICVAAFVTLMPLVFLTIINDRLHLRSYFYGMVGFVFIASVIAHPTMMIFDMEKLDYTFTRVAGKYYWVFTTYCIVLLLITLGALVRSYRAAEIEIERVKSANLLVAFIPVVVAIISVILLMRLGFSISANGVLPLLLSFLVLAMAENLRKNSIFDLRIIIPGARKFSMALTAIKPLHSINMNQSDQHYVKEYEKILMEIAEAQFATTKEKMDFLKKSKTSYYRALKELSKE